MRSPQPVRFSHSCRLVSENFALLIWLNFCLVLNGYATLLNIFEILCRIILPKRFSGNFLQK